MSQHGFEPTGLDPASEFDLPQAPPAWPKVIGIISIVWGSLGVLCGTCGVIMTVAMGPFMEQMAKLQQQGGQPPMGQALPTTPIPPDLKPNAVQLAAAVVSPAIAILLIVAGSALCMRKASGRTLHIAYAVLSIVFTILGIVGALMYAGAVDKFIAGNPADEWAEFFKGQGGGASQAIQSVLIGIFALVYPAFLAVWFLFVKKRPEDIGMRLEEPAA